MRSRLFFAIVGALAAMMAAGLLEALFWCADVAGRFDGTVAPALIFEGDVARRLERAGAGSGDVQVALAWNNINDLDLHCVDPRGEHIFYGHRYSHSGGQLDIDMNVSPETIAPVEHIFWPGQNAPPGVYKVYVNHYRSHGAPDPTSFGVEVHAQGETRHWSGAVSHGDPPALVCQFTVRRGLSLPWWLRRDFLYALVVVALWAAAIAASMGVMLAAIQSLLPCKPCRPAYGITRTRSGAVAGGFLAGIIGQLVFAWISSWLPFYPLVLGRLLGYAMLGLLMGGKLSRVVPNLPLVPGRVAGALGGLVAAFVFSHTPDVENRILAAAAIGFLIGLMIVLPCGRSRCSRKPRTADGARTAELSQVPLPPVGPALAAAPSNSRSDHSSIRPGTLLSPATLRQRQLARPAGTIHFHQMIRPGSKNQRV